jgi:hypothetical protein
MRMRSPLPLRWLLPRGPSRQQIRDETLGTDSRPILPFTAYSAGICGAAGKKRTMKLG